MQSTTTRPLPPRGMESKPAERATAAEASQVSSPLAPFLQHHPALDLTVVTITPQQASDLLARRRNQSPDHPAAIRAYAEAMRAGDWLMNGMPIVLSRGGALLDGVQRLRACQAAGRPLTTLLANGVADDVVHTMDQHRRRSFAAILEARGVPEAAAVQSALVRLLHYQDGVIDRSNPPAPPWARLDRVLAANPDIPLFAATGRAEVPRHIPGALRIPLLVMGRRADAAALRRLFDAVGTPDAFPAQEPGVLLRHEIDRAQEDETQRMSMLRAFALAIVAFNATRADTQLRRLAWVERRSAGRAGDPFPVLDGYDGLAEAAAVPPAALPRYAGDAVERLSWRIETIDAAQAQTYLRENTANRRIVQAHVDGIARDITAGRWMLNAQPICFARDGRLLNGQHRLMAVVAASGVIEVAVVRGLPEEAQATYDVQVKRGVDFNLGLEGFGDAALLGAMVNLLWRHEKRPPGTRKAKATAAELRDIAAAHPRLRELRGYARRMLDFGRASVVGYAAYVIEREDPAQGALFLKALETGAHLAEQHPILMLRRNMQRLRRSKATAEEQLQTLLQGWARCRTLKIGD